jgi:hypothetical protein
VSGPRHRALAASPAAGWSARLRRHLALVLLLKLALLVALFLLFFSPAHRPADPAGTVTARLHLPR